MERKDLGRRKGGIFQRLGNWITGSDPLTSQDGYISHGSTVTNWSRDYDDRPLDGDKVVGGKHCKTVGEYKAACAKFYGPSGN